MKRITLKKMKLKNFKGVRSLEISFGRDTSVFGRNGTGKTTIYDAFTWVLFDKDSRSCGSFQIATNDKDGKFIPRLEHEVSITLDIDGETFTLTKRIADKWITQRGTTTPKLKGWESLYQINDVPCKKADFDKFVGNICGYDTFKMVTMPGYFMTKPENERRAILLNMAGVDLNNENIVGDDKDLEAVIKVLENKTYEDVNKQMKGEKSKYNKERDELQSGIVTLNGSIREDLPTLEEVEQLISDGEQMIRDIDSLISDRTSSLRTAQEQNRNRQNDILKANNDLARLINQKIESVKSRKRKIESDIRDTEYNIQNIQIRVELLQQQSEEQLAIYNEKAAKREEIAIELVKANLEAFTVKSDDIYCPTCGHIFEGGMYLERINELRQQFNERKAKRLAEIQNRGKANTALRDKAQQENSRILAEKSAAKQNIEKYQSQLESLKKELGTIEIPTEEYLTKVDVDVIAAVNKRDRLMESAESELPKVDVSDLQSEQQEIRQRQGQLHQLLAEIKRNNDDKERVLQMEHRISDISAAIAEMELMEDQLIKFSRKRAMMLEEKVNKMFAMVDFKFLVEQINGGIKEVCEPYYNGSPYSTNLNNGARINAGIDICTAIASYYGIEAPIFVDNAEASNTFIHTDSQLVKLIVSEDDQLKIISNN